MQNGAADKINAALHDSTWTQEELHDEIKYFLGALISAVPVKFDLAGCLFSWDQAILVRDHVWVDTTLILLF